MPKRPETILVADYINRFIWFDSNKSFTSSIASGIIKMLKKMEDKNHKPIVFYIRNSGGDFYAFIRVAHVMEAMESPIKFVPFDFVKSGAFWLSGCGSSCFPMPGTSFGFHRANQTIEIKNKNMSQFDCLILLDKLKLVDAFQLWVFTRRGAPISKVENMLLREDNISSKEAIKFRLAEGFYRKKDFNKDRKRAIKLAQIKYKF